MGYYKTVTIILCAVEQALAGYLTYSINSLLIPSSQFAPPHLPSSLW